MKTSTIISLPFSFWTLLFLLSSVLSSHSARALTLESTGQVPTPASEPAAPVPESQPRAPGLDLSQFQLSAALDLLAPIPLQNSAPDSERFRARSAEVAIYGAVDPTFDAMINFAGHDEGGDFEVTLHEGYVSSSRLIPQSRFRLGKFLLGVGRLNQFHQHDWPFPSAPKSHASFFADEGVLDAGLEYSWLLPTDFFLDLTFGITNGYSYGHSHNMGGARALTPTHYLHPVFFFGDAAAGLQVGVTYLGRTSSDGEQMRLVGTDLTYKRRAGRLLEWLVQAELYHRFRQPSGVALAEEMGGYVYAQRAINEQLSAGLRIDGFTLNSLRFGTGEKRNNFDYAFVPVLSYQASEFSIARAAYTLANETRQGDSNRVEQRIELQLVTILGAHPAHDF